MKLSQIKYFIAVAEELHFGRAAQRLHRSQPPISRQIRLLEDELDVELFKRNTQSVALTHAGNVFLKEVRPALIAIQNAADAAKRAAVGQIGTLSIGMTASIMFGILPSILTEFRRRYPEIVVNLRLATKAEQLAAVKECRLSVGLVRSLSQDADLCHEALLNEPLEVAMGPTNPLAAKAQIQLAELVNEDFILYRGHSPTSLADTIISACHTAGFSPRIIQETDDMQSAAALATLGIGITLVASSLTQLGLPGLVCRPILQNGTPLTIPLYAVYMRSEMSIELTAFLSLVRTMCQTLDKHV
ncbi:LysR substrate-binding domain-containing protein [Pollutimonas bauzanensis]|uniref:LysR substrate-binding domain-containing protein n=1 Tax=Pollutimonas bauzanensis TaxID=658167 RepID=UPI0033408082